MTSEIAQTSQKNAVPDSPKTQECPMGEPLSARYKGTFAYKTVKDRLPVIVTKVVDQLCRDKEKIWSKYGEDSKGELKGVIGKLSQLRSEIQTNKPLTPILSESEDAVIWNACLEEEKREMGSNVTWFDSRWLLVENYMYRKIWEAFEVCQHMTNYDYFAAMKEEAYLSSKEMMVQIAESLQSKWTTSEEIGILEVKEQFKYLLESNLWSNRCDLSFSGGSTSDFTQQLEMGLKERHANIIVNDWNQVWELLLLTKNNPQATGQLGIVMDNAGLELFNDLCLADFLCTTGSFSSVIFYVKAFPWYVSDVIHSDVMGIIQKMKDETKHSALNHLGQRWEANFQTNKWSVAIEQFWTLPYNFSQMKEKDSSLYEKLQKHDFILVKGDLNYRKLLADVNWPMSRAFRDTVCGFSPANFAVIRTLKSDVVVGVPCSYGEELDAHDPSWKVSGDFGMIQLYKR